MAPWDVKALVERLKSKGLVAAEAALKIVAGETIEWVSESLALSEGMIPKFAAPIVAGLKPILLAEIDKIDGVQGN